MHLSITMKLILIIYKISFSCCIEFFNHGWCCCRSTNCLFRSFCTNLSFLDVSLCSSMTFSLGLYVPEVNLLHPKTEVHSLLRQSKIVVHSWELGRGRSLPIRSQHAIQIIVDEFLLWSFVETCSYKISLVPRSLELASHPRPWVDMWILSARR